LAGDKDERKKKLIMGAFSQYFEAIPFFGNDLFAAVSGKYFGYGGVKIFPAIDYLTRLPAQIKAENYEDAAVNLLKGAAFGAGLPVSGPTKAAKAIKTKELRAILGWK